MFKNLDQKKKLIIITSIVLFLLVVIAIWLLVLLPLQFQKTDEKNIDQTSPFEELKGSLLEAKEEVDEYKQKQEAVRKADEQKQLEKIYTPEERGEEEQVELQPRLPLEE